MEEFEQCECDCWLCSNTIHCAKCDVENLPEDFVQIQPANPSPSEIEITLQNGQWTAQTWIDYRSIPQDGDAEEDDGFNTEEYLWEDDEEEVDA